MKSVSGGKIWIIFLALVALTGLIVLASGMKELKFEPPHLVKLENLLNLSDAANGSEIPESSWIRYVFPGMIILIFLLFLGPIRPMTAKDLIKMLLRFSLIAIVAMLVLGGIAQKNSLFNNNEQEATAIPGSSGDPQNFSPPVVSSTWEFWIAALIVVVVSVVLYIVFNRFIDKWFQPKKGLDEIADIARSTLNDLSGKKVSKNTIIGCYVRMNSAVNEYRGITREAAMTPAEFAQHLEHAGLPRDGVQGLTHLFEKVRYGTQNIGTEEIKEAKQCLTSILKACKTRA
ncbi:MAG: DUF4129 domain-containing protein [Chloroflexi bacterium]|nr:DUF4129 domain-containing protein [Chloroflexota bacterium]